MKKILVNLIIILGAVNLFANVGIFSGSGTDLKLSESQELQMQSEIVEITALPSETLIDSKGRNRFWAKYKCEFILKNLSDKDISTRVGFPLSGDDRFSDGAATIKNRDFKVYSQSFDIKDFNTYEVQYIPYDKENNFSHIFYWDMDFRANKAIKLSVYYKLAGYFGLASTLKREDRRNYKDLAPYQQLLLTTLAQSFNYVTRTGDTWAGDIESAKFIFDLGNFDKSLEKAFPFDLGETKTDPKYEKKQIEMNFLKNGQYYRTLDFQAALKDDTNLPTFEDKGDGLYIADIAPFKPTKGFAVIYFFTAYPRDVEGLDYLMSGIERIYELNNEKLKTRKDFEPQVFSDKDKADLADIILEFYGISRNNEAIKDFLNRQSYYPTSQHPQIDEALKAKLLEISEAK